MYQEGQWEEPFAAISDPPLCSSQSPGKPYMCSLGEGHSGVHRAGVDLSRWVAEWDDDRSTDALRKVISSQK